VFSIPGRRRLSGFFDFLPRGERRITLQFMSGPREAPPRVLIRPAALHFMFCTPARFEAKR
jgi:hypothetical protein